MRKIEGAERDAVILDIIRRLENDTQRIADPEREQVWESGWAEAAATGDPVPKYVRADRPVRWQGALYHQDDELNELDFIRRVQRTIGEWLSGVATVAEFGCGTGWNLLELQRLTPGRRYIGCERAKSAVDMVASLGIEAHRFDMLAPEYDLPENAGVFTFGAIEQLASRFHPFVEYLIAQRPAIVVHVEPTIELYDPDVLLDALAIRFHRKRGYTEGLLPWLQSDPRVSLERVERMGFGSLMMEGYNLMVWRPK